MWKLKFFIAMTLKQVIWMVYTLKGVKEVCKISQLHIWHQCFNFRFLLHITILTYQ